MMEIKSRKKVMVALAIVAVAAVAAVSFIVYPTFASVADVEAQNRHVSAKAVGLTFQRIDNETIKQGTVELMLDVELGRSRGNFVAIPNVSGSANVSGTIYTIESGRGLINTEKHIVLLRCIGTDSEGNEATFGIAIIYFWWGGDAYAFRAKAVLKTAESPMLLLLRGAAKIQ
jgi:hypothetical protein